MLPAPILAVAAFGIAACAPLAEPVPIEARLASETVQVLMSDGHRCFGPRPAAAMASGWSGALEGCNVSYPYEVRIDRRANPLQQAAQAVFAALALDSLLSVPAEVEVTGPVGRRYVFASPPPLD